jgi:signal transduction histidine kinase
MIDETGTWVADRRRRSDSLERTMLALRDAREVHDVLAIVARSLGRDFKRPCVAYELRDGSLRAIASSEPPNGGPGISADQIDLEALRLRVVVRHGDNDLLSIATDGQLRALLVLERAVGPLPNADLKYLRAVAAHVSLALANALAFDQLRRYAAEGAALTDAARTILGFTELEPLARSLCRLALRLALAERACIYVHRGDGLERIAFAASREELGPPERVPLGEVDSSRALAVAFGSSPLIVTRLRLPSEGSNLEHNGLLVVSRSQPFERSELRMIETLKSLAALAIRNVDLYEQTTSANRLLEESNSFKDDLMAMFAHDFKGPLTVISGFSELLSDDDDPKVRRNAETIMEQTRRLARLSEDALTLAATQSAGFSLRREPEDFAEFIRTSVEPLDRTGRIVVEAPGEPVVLALDRLRFRHVIDNVIGNALKYSSGKVVVRISVDDEEVRADITDDGIGIPSADLAKVFSRYGRGANARSRGIAGSGVGLYIAKKIVEVHGGRLEVSSVENEGSTFTIALPHVAVRLVRAAPPDPIL